MRKSLSLVILAAAALSLGGMDACLAQGASDASPNAAPAKPGMHKQKMSNSRSAGSTAKPAYSHRAMRKRLKKSPPQSKQPQSQRSQPVAKR